MAYGNKAAPRARFNVDPLTGLVGLGSLIPGINNSPVGGNFLNLLSGIRSEGQWQDFQGQVDANNRVGDQALAGIGFGDRFNVGGAAQRLSRQGQGLANQFYDQSDTRDRFNQAFGGVRSGLNGLPSQIAGQTGGYLGDYSTVAGAVNQGFQGLGTDVGGGYEQLADRARGLVSGISDQDQRDANRRYDQFQAQQRGNLVSQGLSGSTVGASVAGGIEGQRSDELRRLSDQRLREQLGVEQAFGGQGLAARERIGGAGLANQANMAGNYLSGGLSAAGLNANTGLNALQQRGDIAGQYFGAQDMATQNRLAAMQNFGQLPINTALDVTQMGLGWYGPQRTLVQPQPFQPFNIQPPVRR